MTKASSTVTLFFTVTFLFLAQSCQPPQSLDQDPLSISSADSCPNGQKQIFVPIGIDPIIFAPICDAIPCGDDICENEIGEKCYTCEQDCGACDHDCSPVGRSKCKNETVFKCDEDPLGSNYWKFEETCSNYCIDGQCQACIHDCDFDGQKKCVSDVYSMCSYGFDDCLDWIIQEYCLYGCEGTQCITVGRTDLKPFLPNAYPSGFKPSGKIYPDRWFQFRIEVCNKGRKNAADSKAKLRVENFHSSYLFDESKTEDVPFLTPDSCHEVIWEFGTGDWQSDYPGLPGSEQDYFFTVTIDSGNDVDEGSGEDNNTYWTKKTIDYSGSKSKKKQEKKKINMISKERKQ